MKKFNVLLMAALVAAVVFDCQAATYAQGNTQGRRPAPKRQTVAQKKKIAAKKKATQKRMNSRKKRGKTPVVGKQQGAVKGNYYDMVGAQPTDDLATIKAKFSNRFSTVNPAQRGAVLDAFLVLNDANQRTVYDMTLIPAPPAIPLTTEELALKLTELNGLKDSAKGLRDTAKEKLSDEQTAQQNLQAQQDVAVQAKSAVYTAIAKGDPKVSADAITKSTEAVAKLPALEDAYSNAYLAADMAEKDASAAELLVIKATDVYLASQPKTGTPETK